jgi:hypothetical protein
VYEPLNFDAIVGGPLFVDMPNFVEVEGFVGGR